MRKAKSSCIFSLHGFVRPGAALSILTLIAMLLLARVSYGKVSDCSRRRDVERDEALYLPNGKALKFLSFGYSNALAHTLWFNTINYFGKHFRSDRNYDWLNHMCGLVTDLNPELIYVYDFCSLMLAWEAGRPEDSIAMLNKGISHHPKDWKFRYLRGMNYLIFLKDAGAAKDDFIAASKLPNAHPTVKRLAAKNISVTEGREDAILFLEEMAEASQDSSEKAALLRKLEELKAE